MQGIKACPEKAEAVMKLQSLQTLKEAQNLNGKLASLNKFQSKSMKKSLPFFKTLKRCVKKSDFKWTPEAKRAFQNMKKCIAELPIVTAPKPKEELIMYLCAAMEAVSAVLLTERDLRQVPIYFVSHALQTPEINYNSMEKLVLALVHATKRLRRFEFDVSNNEAEYEAIVAGLRIAEQMGVKSLVAKVDSRLVANQINGLYEAKEQSMTQYLEKAKTLIDSFKTFSIDFGGDTKKKVNRRKGNPSSGGRRRVLLDDTDDLAKDTLPTKAKKAHSDFQEKSYLTTEDNPFKDWCEKLNIKQKFTSVKHPQTNSQVERANRSLGEEIKARLGEDNINWVKEVLHVLWAHRTMIKTSNEDTPFSLTYGTKAMIPVEIGMPSLRCTEVNQAENDEGLLLNMYILEERREQTAVREARSKAKMEKYYNAKVCSTSFRPVDFVYRNNEASHAKESEKLGPKWEGPYGVVEALGKEAYKLRNGIEDVFPRTWNFQDLKKCYL
ncbi:reverse transcriptase domain-containing protein [Tanacetum coccineum]